MKVREFAAFGVVSVIALGVTAPALALTVLINDNFDQDALFISSSAAHDWGGDAYFDNVANVGALFPGSKTKHQISSVDVIGSNFHLCSPDKKANHCIDLDGTTGKGNNPAGELRSKITLKAGHYKLSFALRGNGRNIPKTNIAAPPKTTVISIGNWSTTLTLSSAANWATYTFNVVTNGGKLDFLEKGPSDLQGNVLDNVYLATPEPAAWVMMLAGFGAAGVALRRKRKVVKA